MYTTDEELERWIKEYASEGSLFAKAFMKMMEEDAAMETIVDPVRMSDFLRAVKNIKEYCSKKCTTPYKIIPSMFEVSKANGDIDVICERFPFESLEELSSMIGNASWMCLGLTNDNLVKISIEFWGIAKPIKNGGNR